MDQQPSQIETDIQTVNAGEEWLLKARRVAHQIGDRVKKVIGLDGFPTLHAPGVEAAEVPEDPGPPPQPQA
jgi:hypothetical protein